MPEIRDRLMDCFNIVFPEIPVSELPKASVHSLPAWDSVATITLIAALESEFRITIPPDAVTDLGSFELTLDHLMTNYDLSAAKAS